MELDNGVLEKRSAPYDNEPPQVAPSKLPSHLENDNEGLQVIDNVPLEQYEQKVHNEEPISSDPSPGFQPGRKWRWILAIVIAIVIGNHLRRGVLLSI